MITKSTVKKLLVLEVGLALFGSYVEQEVLSTMPFAYRGGSSDELGALELVLGIPLLILGICAFIGVYRFMRRGRSLYVLFHVLGLLLLALEKPHAATGIGGLFGGTSAMIAGAIIALLYVTPLKEHFAKKQTPGAAPGPVGPEEPIAAKEANLAMADEPLPGEMSAVAVGDEAEVAVQEPEEKNLIDRFTDLIFPGSAAARAMEKPPKQRKKRRVLLLVHYVFILFLFFVIILTEYKVNALVIVALGFVIFNLAQRKGQPLAVLFPALLAAYCLVPIISSLFGFMLSNFSKSFLPYLIPYLAGWLLLMLIENDTHKFIRDYDQPLPERSRNDGPKSEKP